MVYYIQLKKELKILRLKLFYEQVLTKVMKKILITGSEGFAGQHLVKALEKEYSIIGISRHEVLDSTENIVYKNGDILDQKFMEDLIKEEKPDVIFHLAAIAITWKGDPEEIFRINFNGTLNIYESVLKVKKDSEYDPKIIYVSTSDVYGKTKNPESITEDAPFFPVNFYAVSKVSADRLSYQYSQTHKLNITILRPFNHTGPGQREGFFVPDMASQIAKIEKDPTISEIKVGNLNSVKDFLDVRDVANAYKLAIEKDLKPGEAYNICSTVGFKFEDILEKLLSLSSKKITKIPDPEKMRPSEIPVLIGNNAKFIEATGWKQNYSLDQTLSDTLNYWRGKI